MENVTLCRIMVFTQDSALPSCALAIMAKAPRSGAVKTRLVPPLTHDQAAALGACFLRDTLNTVRQATRETHTHGFLLYAPADAADEMAAFAPHEFTALPQRGATLGARLTNAVADIYALGYDSLCLLGADSPTLPAAFLVTAVGHLQRPGERVVIGPADDGGYYLIGLKTPCYELFEEIAWSSENVLTQTLAQAATQNLAVELLPAWYDVDDAASLRRLVLEVATQPLIAPHTRLCLPDLQTI